MTNYKHQIKTNTIYCGDNLKMLREVPTESVDLIYIDPPFNSGSNYEMFWGDTMEKRAFEDRFGDAQDYINYMKPRTLELYRVLKKTGSFYYHCDWHASHYVKIMLDNIFDFANFQNEIIWKRTNNPKGSQFKDRRFGVYTDSIFFYTKSNKYTFELDKIKEPLTPEEIIEKYNYKDNKGSYYPAPIIRGQSMGERENLVYEYKGYTPERWGWRLIKEKLIEIDGRGDLGWSKNGVPYRKLRPHEDRGKPLGNLWIDIKRLSGNSSELRGYKTQKPLELLRRIIEASSNEGDMVLDAFCGCGTTLIEAQKLKRKWIGIDISPTACRTMSQRLWDMLKLNEGTDFMIEDLRKSEEELRILPHFEFQNWACIALGGIPNKRKTGDFGIDGKLYPIDMQKKKRDEHDLFGGQADIYYPIQVKQVDKAGRPDMDAFQTAIRRDGRKKGYFVAFDFSKDSIHEIKRLDKEGDIQIIPITVGQLIKMEVS